MVFHTPLQWLTQNINQILNSQKPLHISPSRLSYGVSIVRIGEKIDRVITAPHFATEYFPVGMDACIFNYFKSHCWVNIRTIQWGANISGSNITSYYTQRCSDWRKRNKSQVKLTKSCLLILYPSEVKTHKRHPIVLYPHRWTMGFLVRIWSKDALCPDGTALCMVQLVCKLCSKDNTLLTPVQCYIINYNVVLL